MFGVLFGFKNGLFVIVFTFARIGFKAYFGYSTSTFFTSLCVDKEPNKDFSS
jgi:hypothetical protein